jgi:hypothetical protein
MNPKTSHLLTAAVSVVFGGVAVLFFQGILDRAGSSDAADRAAITLDPAALGNESSTIAELPVDDPRISFRQLTAIAGRLAAKDPEAAVKRAKDIPGHDNREAYLGEVLRAWGEKDGVAAATFAREYFNGQQLTDALYYIADGWAEADPAGAAKWYHENTEGTVLDDAMWEALESWGRKDPAAAFAWTANLDDFVKSTSMKGLAEGWGAVDPAGAAAAGLEMRDTDYGRDFLVSVMTQWAGSDPEKAAAWSAGLVDEELRGGVTQELGEIWSHTDPDKAAAWAASIADPGQRRAAETGIAIGWAEHDPAGAVDWAVDAVKDPEQLDEMVGDIVFMWSNLDPRGATRWLDQQPAGVKTDQILKSFSSTIVDDDPGSAAAWASRISDPAARDEHLRGLLDGLVETYGDSARRAIQDFSIPEEFKRAYTVP